MKKSVFLFAIICILFSVQTTLAQNPVTTLQHNGATTVFYGITSFSDALGTAAKGDTLYLSTGFFNAPTNISKGVKVIGAGHFPDSAIVAKRTTITSGLTINAGADSLLLEGLYIDGNISYNNASSINYVKVFRCYLNSALFNSNSATASKNFCSYEECFIDGYIIFNSYGTNLLIKHCIITSTISNINGSALIDGNILLRTGTAIFSYIQSTLIQNNIIFCPSTVLSNCSSNYFKNNVFIASSFSFGTNSSYGNYFGIPQANIFVNQTGNTIDYTHDYHLKSPTTYIGTDGTQVGLYGGTAPFKDKGYPTNPQILKKTIGDKTDNNGNLPINFTIKAQGN